MTWQTVYESFLHNPRDVKTTPKTHQTPLWLLDKNNFTKMMNLNDQRDRGFSVSEEARSVTVNQVYWFGIFHDIQQ